MVTTPLNLSELDDLINSFAEADRPATRELLTRNPAAATLLSAHRTVYDAFVGGEPGRIAAVIPPAAAPAVAPAAAAAAAATPVAAAPVAPQTLTIGLDQLNAMLDARDQRILASPAFTTAVEARAKDIATSTLAAARPEIVGQAFGLSDEASRIRDAHYREFGEELDRTKFDAFFLSDGSKYGNRISDTYNAWIQQRRIDKQIADGIAAGLVAQQTSQVPATTLPTANNPQAPNFIEHNMRTIGQTVTPSADVDKAAQAFSSMQRGWAN